MGVVSASIVEPSLTLLRNFDLAVQHEGTYVVYIYISQRTYICFQVHTYIDIVVGALPVYTCMHTYICMCTVHVYVYAYVHTYIYLRMYVHTYACKVCMYICMCTYNTFIQYAHVCLFNWLANCMCPPKYILQAR